MSEIVLYAGSKWRHWDLHVHTPDSYERNFPGATDDERWERYLAHLAGLQGVSVLGITDYFTLSGYQKVAEAHASGKLPGVELVLPNIELRLQVSTDSDRHLNVHVIASPGIANELPSLLLGKLEFIYNNDPYTCRREDLQRLGRLVSGNSSLASKEAFEAGARQFKVSLSDLRNAFQKSNRLRHNALIAVPNSSSDGNSGIRDSSSTSLRKEIYRLADIIITSREQDRAHFLGQGEDWSVDRALEDYRCLKPCIFGSDAKDLREIGNPPNDRRTWVRADPTFEGLQQICFEPQHRVRISATPPPEPIHRIEGVSIRLPDDATLFADSVEEQFCLRGDHDLEFSSGLTCIIGGRGSGKSTLLSLIGEAISGESLLFEDMEIRSGGKRLVIPDHVEVRLTSSATGVEFLSQNQIEAFALDHSKLTEAIYSRLERLDGSSAITEARAQLERELGAIEKLRQLTSERHKILATKERKEIQLASNRKLVSSLEDEDYLALVTEAATANKALSAVRSAREALSGLVSEVQEAVGSEPKLAERTDAQDDLAADYRRRQATLYSAIQAALEEAKQGQDLDRPSEAEESLEDKTAEVDRRMAEYLSERGIPRENVDDLASASSRASLLEEEIETLNSELGELARIEESVDRNPQARHDFENALRAQIKPLNERLRARQESELARISVVYDFDNKAAIDDCIAKLASSLSEKTDDRAVRSDYLGRVLSKLDWIDLPTLAELKSLMEEAGTADRATTKRLLAYLEQPGRYENFIYQVESAFADAGRFMRIEIRYDGKPLDRASFGQRCSAALILLVMLGNRPIIIDEPEAHLDSALIADLLVSLIKDRKHTRQIIFATHNANFVVNGDSELIHVLTLDGTSPTSIESGSLEDRDHRSAILRLEGGARAFRQREERYGFRDRFAPPVSEPG